MANIKLFFDYSKRLENKHEQYVPKRYWVVNTKTGKKIEILPRQYDELLSSWDDIWDGKKIPEQE